MTNLQGYVSGLTSYAILDYADLRNTMKITEFHKEAMATAKDFQATHFHPVVEGVKCFLTNYIKENAIKLPARIPGYKN